MLGMESVFGCVISTGFFQRAFISVFFVRILAGGPVKFMTLDQTGRTNVISHLKCDISAISNS